MRALRFHTCASRFIVNSKKQCLNFKCHTCLKQTSIQNFSCSSNLNVEQKYKSFVKTSLDESFHNSNELVALDDPDNFGLLSKTNDVFSKKYEQDEGDKKEEKFIGSSPLPSSRLSIKKYSDLIKDHLEKHQIKEAIDVLEVKMLQEDRAKPDNYIYNLLISGCAQVGYTKKAFMLFNDMKRRGLKTTGGTYTSLFNACANSPWPEDGLKRATELRSLMSDKLCEPNVTNFNATIKAFGRCGDIQKAFGVVDEMNSLKIKIRVHTFNFLLQSCISDKKTGFLHALLIWRKMISVREKPNIYTFNLMLRCAKECQFGYDLNTEVINKIIPDFSDNAKIKSQLLKSENNVTSCIDTADSKELSTYSVNIMPNLISKIPHMGSVISFNQINRPEDKLMLIGGLDGFLKEFGIYNVIPNIKTMTQLLDVTPSSIEVEEKLLDVIKHHKLKTDIDFYNMLMKKRCFRCDYVAAKDVFNLIEQDNAPKMKKFYLRKKILKPNVMTYGILALTCQTLEEAKTFLNEIKEKRIRVNSEIVGTLINNASYKNDFEYIFFVFDYVQQENIPINKMFIDNILKFRKRCKNKIATINLKIEKTNDDNDFVQKWKNFSNYYNKWIQTNGKTSEKIEYDHPWKQFRENQQIVFQKPTLGRIKGIRYHKKKNVKFVKYEVKI